MRWQPGGSMKCPTFGPNGSAWHIRGPASKWRHVLVESVSDDCNMLIVRPYNALGYWPFKRVSNQHPELGEQEDIPASMICPASLVFCPNQPRKRHIPHGSTWAWRQGASPIGEPWHIDPHAPWHMWPSGRRLPVS